MIISETFELCEIHSLIVKLFNSLPTDGSYPQVFLFYDTEKRFFDVTTSECSNSVSKPVTIEEERAFEKGGSHATPSECSL